MKLSINSTSALALREFAEKLPTVMQTITEDTLKLASVYQSVQEELGEHRQDFLDMLLLVKSAQEKAGDAVNEIPPLLIATAEKIEAYIARTSGATNQTTAISSGVTGKNISGSFAFDPIHYYDSTYQAALMQGYLGLPRVVGPDEFKEAVTKSGMVCFRTLNSGDNCITGVFTEAIEFKQKMLYSNDFQLNGSGKQVYGGGMYCTSTPRFKQGQMPSSESIGIAKAESTVYADDSDYAVATMTVSPDARIGDYAQVFTEFTSLPEEECLRFGGCGTAGIGAYAISKGYDGLVFSDSELCDYLIMYNRTKMIILND